MTPDQMGMFVHALTPGATLFRRGMPVSKGYLLIKVENNIKQQALSRNFVDKKHSKLVQVLELNLHCEGLM